jgi:serine protease Do
MTLFTSLQKPFVRRAAKRGGRHGYCLFTASVVLLVAGHTHFAGAAMLPQDEAPELVLVSAPASYLGVNIADVDEHAVSLLKLKSTDGAEVTAVDRDAPAGKAGIHLRDVILAVDGHQVTSAQQFRETMRGYAPLKQVVLSILRDGKPMSFTIKLADRAKLQAKIFERRFNAPMPALGNSFSSAAARFSGEGTGDRPNGDDDRLPEFFGGSSTGWGMGAELDPIGPQLAGFFGVKDGTGMLVKSIEPGSPAAAAGLQAGDVVLKLNDENLLDPIDWVRALEAGRGKPMQLTIVRNKHVETLTMPAVPHTQAMLRPQILVARTICDQTV